jgi:hypothetical protein
MVVPLVVVVGGRLPVLMPVSAVSVTNSDDSGRGSDDLCYQVAVAEEWQCQ